MPISWRLCFEWRCVLLIMLSMLVSAFATAQNGSSDPLPSWNNGPAKKSILDFVADTTTEISPDFVPPDQRIATFDHDGTLWLEQPVVTELVFAIDRVKALAAQHPEWKHEQPFKAAIEDDQTALFASGEAGIGKIIAASHAGVTTDEFGKIVEDWISTTQNQRYKRLYTNCVYQPMLEVLAYLRANGFKTYIISSGDVDFLRPWSQRVYGVPPEQVIGSSFKMKFEMRGEKPVLMRLPETDPINDGPGKAIGTLRFIGKRPLASFGNSDDDQQMLEWTAAGAGLRLMLIVHHTDADREYAYDRISSVGRLDKVLDEATAKGWVIVDTKRDWKAIFPSSEAH